MGFFVRQILKQLFNLASYFENLNLHCVTCEWLVSAWWLNWLNFCCYLSIYKTLFRQRKMYMIIALYSFILSWYRQWQQWTLCYLLLNVGCDIIICLNLSLCFPSDLQIATVFLWLLFICCPPYSYSCKLYM